MKHVIVIETDVRLKPAMLTYLLANINSTFENICNIMIASQSNQPNDDILVIPNATKNGEPRYTSI